LSAGDFFKDVVGFMCGFSPWACEMRLTLVSLMPVTRAMVRRIWHSPSAKQP
jgi:hypothetical protein